MRVPFVVMSGSVEEVLSESSWQGKMMKKIIERVLVITSLLLTACMVTACHDETESQAIEDTSPKIKATPNMDLSRFSVRTRLPLRAGEIADPNSDFVKKWTGKSMPVKLNEHLVLAVPEEYREFWRPPYPREENYSDPAVFNALPTNTFFSVFMHMPDMSGFTLQNFELTKDGVSFDDSLIRVIGVNANEDRAIPRIPDSVADFPPTAFKRLSSGDYPRIDLLHYEEKYGLRCYGLPPETEMKLVTKDNKRYCYGLKDKQSGEYILLQTTSPLYEENSPFNNMEAHYFSPQYGGVTMWWVASMKHFSQWKEIDSGIWERFREWNIVKN